jgi:hypothetical protein
MRKAFEIFAVLNGQIHGDAIVHQPANDAI